MDDAFGHWLAGFVDGEGSFCINVGSNRQNRWCALAIGVRADDRPVLEEIQRQTGLGKIYGTPARGASKPSVRWQVVTKHEVQEVVRLFERYPLRGKKARDFEVWKQAVAVWCSTGGREQAVWRWEAMDALKAQIKAGRVFA